MKKMILLVAAVAGVSLFGMNGTAEAGWRGPLGPRAGVYGPRMAGPDIRIRSRGRVNRGPVIRGGRGRAVIRTPARGRARVNMRGGRMNLRTPGMRLRVR